MATSTHSQQAMIVVNALSGAARERMRANGRQHPQVIAPVDGEAPDRMPSTAEDWRLPPMKALLRRTGQAVLRWPVLRVLLPAVRSYVLHQSANQAGSMAFSSVLAIFPLLILLSATAAYVGEPGDAAALARRVMGYAPQMVRDAVQPVIDQVLAQRNQALLAVGFVVTLWTASSGLQAVRTALNRAYGVERGLPFWKARIKVTLLTVVGGVVTVAAFSSVIVMPYVWHWLEQGAGVGREVPWLRDSVRYGSAFLVLTTLYAVLYGWLPDVRQRLRTVLPGAVVGAVLWCVAAAVLSYTLRTAGKLALVYGSFAGVVATLVFLYATATTLIFGAEVNGVVRERLGRARRERQDALSGHAAAAPLHDAALPQGVDDQGPEHHRLASGDHRVAPAVATGPARVPQAESVTRA